MYLPCNKLLSYLEYSILWYHCCLFRQEYQSILYVMQSSYMNLKSKKKVWFVFLFCLFLCFIYVFIFCFVLFCLFGGIFYLGIVYRLFFGGGTPPRFSNWFQKYKQLNNWKSIKKQKKLSAFFFFFFFLILIKLIVSSNSFCLITSHIFSQGQDFKENMNATTDFSSTKDNIMTYKIRILVKKYL